MTFNISEFSGKLNKHGVARSNLFFTRFGLPQSLLNELTQIPISRDLQFYCRSVQLPELDISTFDYQQQTFGSPIRRPQSLNFPILPVVFMVDADFGVMKIFHRWAQSIVNYDRTGGNLGSVNNALPFEIGYKDEYSTTMSVAVFSGHTNRVQYVYEFSGVYPISIGSVSTAWENGAEVLTLPVGFTYDTLKMTGSRTGQVLADKPGSNTGRFLRFFSSINSTVKTLQQIKNIGAQDAVNQINNVSTIVKNFR
jgi:hypothetical protein